jgi:Zn-dependent protease
MKWSIKLGRYLGIDVYVHVTFLLFLAFIGSSLLMAGGSVRQAVDGVLFFVAVFGCVLMHEYGHALAARRYGIRTRDITLLPIGGVARLERMPDRPMQELWVALAGPAVNVGIIAVLLVWMLVRGEGWGRLDLDLTQGSLTTRLLVVNGMLVVFNMIPAFPMDGGRVLRAMLALKMEYARATQIAATLGQGIALVFAFFGLMGLLGGVGNPMLLFIALFVWIGASQESGLAQFRSTLSGARVRDAMLTQFSLLSPEDPLSRAVDLTMAGSQQDFPVVAGRSMVGVLTRQRLLASLAEHGRSMPVGMAMEREFMVADPWQSLEGLLAGTSGRSMPLVAVLEGGDLVGLVTWENVSDFVMIQTALQKPRKPTPGVPPRLS